MHIYLSRFRNEQENITIGTKDFQNIIKEYFKYIFSIKLEIIKEMDEFLGQVN